MNERWIGWKRQRGAFACWVQCDDTESDSKAETHNRLMTLHALREDATEYEYNIMAVGEIPSHARQGYADRMMRPAR